MYTPRGRCTDELGALEKMAGEASLVGFLTGSKPVYFCLQDEPFGNSPPSATARGAFHFGSKLQAAGKEDQTGGLLYALNTAVEELGHDNAWLSSKKS